MKQASLLMVNGNLVEEIFLDYLVILIIILYILRDNDKKEKDPN